MELLEKSWFVWLLIGGLVGVLTWVGYYAYRVMTNMPDSIDPSAGK
jgi:hypothetical protein